MNLYKLAFVDQSLISFYWANRAHALTLTLAPTTQKLKNTHIMFFSDWDLFSFPTHQHLCEKQKYNIFVLANLLSDGSF